MKDKNKIDVWVTRLSAFQIQCGGLDRLQVWFSKPTYYESKFFTEETHFWTDREVGCLEASKWMVVGGKMQYSCPFSSVFGFDSDISVYVWEKLCAHFGNVDFREWGDYEKENEKCKIENFLLKIPINFTLTD